MKIIDLLNKIANGEEVPKKIKYNNIIYSWDVDGYLHYEDEHHSERAFLEGYRTDMCLNDEVEIIEEDKKIEKIEQWVDVKSWAGNDLKKGLEEQSEFNKNIYYKINEIIERLNKED